MMIEQMCNLTLNPSIISESSNVTINHDESNVDTQCAKTAIVPDFSSGARELRESIYKIFYKSQLKEAVVSIRQFFAWIIEPPTDCDEFDEKFLNFWNTELKRKNFDINNNKYKEMLDRLAKIKENSEKNENNELAIEDARKVGKICDKLRNDRIFDVVYYLESRKDWEKFETARSLSKHHAKIRKSYHDDLKDENKETHQLAVAAYFIDVLALRVGSKTENKTYGACTLLVKHIKLPSENMVVLSFDAKKEVPYENEKKVDENVYKHLQSLVERKKSRPDDHIFDTKYVDSTKLNSYLENQAKKFGMDGLTAKVFRTYHACMVIESKVMETDPSACEMKKIEVYDSAVLSATKLLNHKKSGKDVSNLNADNLFCFVVDLIEMDFVVAGRIQILFSNNKRVLFGSSHFGRLVGFIDAIAIFKYSKFVSFFNLCVCVDVCV